MRDYDVIVVGSGFGGAIAAYELSKAGLSVCVLERGPWFENPALQGRAIQSRPFPRGVGFFHRLLCGITHPLLAPKGVRLNRNGLFEMFVSRALNVACASGVGGGSLAYGGLHSKPLDSHYWDQVSSKLSSEMMAGHYQAVLQQLGSKPAPQRADMPCIDDSAFVDEQKLPDCYWGYRSTHHSTEQPWYEGVDFLQEGSFGSPAGAKITLAESYLLPAMAQGADVKACHQVSSICQQTQGFSLQVADLENNKTYKLRCRKLVLAAGCMNTQKILSHSIEAGMLPEIPRLGYQFSANADLMAIWMVNSQRNNAADGPYQSIYLPREPQGKIQMLQGGISGLMAIPMPGFLRRWLQRQSFLAGMGEDNSNGRVIFSKGRLSMDFDVANDAIIQRMKAIVQELSQRSRKKIIFSEKISTVHPLGGAVISDQAADGVVNHQGEVHQISGLFITDASVFPRALAAPPSLSIAAWSRHVALAMLAGLNEK